MTLIWEWDGESLRHDDRALAGTVLKDGTETCMHSHARRTIPVPYYCTLPKGHEGTHLAGTSGDAYVAEWEG